MKKELGIFILLLVICAVLAVLSPSFLDPTNLQNNARLIGIYGIFSIGMGIVIMTGGIDLSVGSVFALLGVILSMLLVESKLSPILAVLIVVGLTTLLGLFNGFLITKVKMQAFIVTLCGLLFYRGISRFIADDNTKGFGSAEGFETLKFLATESFNIPKWCFWLIIVGIMVGSIRQILLNKQSHYSIAIWLVPIILILLVFFGVLNFIIGLIKSVIIGSPIESFQEFVAGLFERAIVGNLGIPTPFILLLIIAAIMWVVLHRSIWGRYLFAVGRNEMASKYSGINSDLIIISAYVLCGLLTGIAGIVLAFYTNSVSPSSHGNSYELFGIAAAVLGGCGLRGGTGSIIGILIGTALLQVLQNLVNLLGIPSSLNFAVMGVVILLGVLADQILQNRQAKVK